MRGRESPASAFPVDDATPIPRLRSGGSSHLVISHALKQSVSMARASQGIYHQRGGIEQTMPSRRAIEEAIFALLSERKEGTTICPSEVARRLAPKQWRTLMHSVRAVAAQLTLEGRLVVTQKGKEVDALSAHGPIRLKARESALEDDSH